MNNFKVDSEYELDDLDIGTLNFARIIAHDDFDRYTEGEIEMAELLLDICDSGWRETSSEIERKQCKHIFTELRPIKSKPLKDGLYGDLIWGGWCRECGEQLSEFEYRACGECKHFKKMLHGSMCKKWQKEVNEVSNIEFKVANGSCWEGK